MAAPFANPLAALPSVLALRDLRRQLRLAQVGPRPTGGQLTALLELDPLAVLRGLRAAGAPVFGSRSPRWTVRRLVAELGEAPVRHLLDVRPCDLAGTLPLRRLWLHSVATALAAADLGRQTGLLDPEQAYLLGLLHDLPGWLALLGRRQSGAPPAGEPSAWVAHLHLPAELGRLAQQLDSQRARGGDRSPAAAVDPATLVGAAERLAELAGFPHPDAAPDPAANAADPTAAKAAERLRQQLLATLAAVGLSAEPPDAEAEAAQLDDDEQHLFERRQPSRLEDSVLMVLGAGRSDSYRGIVTAVMASALRHGSYDCAVYAKWNRRTGQLVLRSKADSSSRRLVELGIAATAEERAALELALAEQRPVVAEARFGAHQGLCARLAADQLLLVPMNVGFAQPGFLVLDRSLSLQPIQLLRDAPLAASLGLMGSLLNENLLLRRRRDRAQKFALTDPLTRLFNRRMGLGTLEQEIARASRQGHPLTVLMLDLDHFKQLNDTYGHARGDAALRAAADVLRRTLRRTDTPCRYGGEEFLVVLPDTAAEDASVLAARLFTAIEAQGQQLDLPLTASIGLTGYRAGDTVEDLLVRADRALYASKDFGRNRFSADLEADPVPATEVPAAPPSMR